MALEDIIKKFQLKRVNPFQGLVIDADTWRDAHNYHRNQQRLHLLAFHQEGIVSGLGVTAGNTGDLSVDIQPGMAIDAEGNAIVVPQTQRYRLQTSKAGTIHLILQFREVPEGPYQPAEGGQPTRILDAYKIEERDKLPGEPHIELARIDFEPAEKAVRDAKNPAKAGRNEIDLSHRQEARPAAAPPVTDRPAPAPEKPAAPAPAAPARPQETVTIGHAVLGGADAGLHLAGLKNLSASFGHGNLIVNVRENISLEKAASQCQLVYLTGNGRFELDAGQQAALSGLLQSGGIIMGEGCSAAQGEGEGKGAKEFGLAFNQLAGQLQCKLEMVQRGHPLLSNRHVFAEVPPGTEPGMLLEGGHMIYSGSDYGCAWQGGRESAPLPRETIRSAFEMGANIITYARTARA